jgi:hypothetical protein
VSESGKSAVYTIVSVLTPLVIGVLGIVFTNVYKEQEAEANRINQERLELERQQRLLIDKASVIKDYFEYLANKADENQQRAALTVLATLGYTDLVIKVVTSDPTESNVQTLAAIASTAVDSDSANRAFGALESIARTTPTEVAAVAADVALTTAQSNQAPEGAGTVVVAGADRTLESAQVEVDKLKAAGFTEVQVVKRGDWYRTVVSVQPDATASSTLSKIKAEVRPGAYAVNMKQWCETSPQSTDCVVTKP